MKAAVEIFRRKLDSSSVALLVLVGLYLGLWPLESSFAFVFALRRILQGLLYIVGGLVLMRWVIPGMRWIARRFLWRVRRRMAAVFFFVGALPMVLGGLMAVWGALLLFGPLAAYMVTTHAGRHIERLNTTAELLLWQLRVAPPQQRGDFLEAFAADAEQRFPSLRVYANVDGVELTVPAGARPLAIPDKLADYVGTVRHGSESLFTGLAADAAGGDRVLLAVPLTPAYMERMLPGLGILAVGLGDGAREIGQDLQTQVSSAREGDRASLAGGIPAPAHPLDWRFVWPIQLSLLDWETNEILSGVFLLETRLSAIARMIFAGQAEPINRAALYFGYGLVGMFGIAVFASLGVAVSLTRTLTRAVNDLYVGTQHVNQGDFSYRVSTSGTDQISDLSRSFNAMTASIERLVEDSKERERLETELSIAREVQAKLFPPEPPQLESLKLLGVCRPAQSVSGDFFDYVGLADNRVAVTFGDVSGKGISAALVMATLHSIVRTQLALLTRIDSRELGRSAAELVDRTNKQLCESTAADKFSTLFFSVYDEESSRLFYANGGHLPPLLVRRGKVEPLDVHGMVVGAFPFASYEHGVVTLEAGDLLVAFTDGVTEPENAYGQEFGEDRLRELLLLHGDRPLEEILATVMREVVEWTDDPTLQDDMTMLAARRF